MNIIFGREQAESMKSKYTILELDTFKIGDQEVAAFCAVDNIPILDMPRIESMKNLHENLIIEYKKKNWNYCIQALEHLTGFWGQEVDTFYESLNQRIHQYADADPGNEWHGVIVKN